MAPTGPALDNTLGAWFIGVMLSTAVYGITCLQAYLYFTHYKGQDNTFLQTFVASLMALDTVHVALIMFYLYHASISNFGNYDVFETEGWSSIVQALIAAIIASGVQCFFGYRVFRLSLSHNRWIPVVIFALAVGQVVGFAGFTVKGLKHNKTADIDSLTGWSSAGLLAELVCDALITAALVFYLRRGRTQFANTNKGINMLMTYSLNTGLLTTIFTVLTLVFSFVAHGHAFIYSIFYFILARLYCCSLISTLNCREQVRDAMSSGSDHVTLSHLASSTAASAGDSRAAPFEDGAGVSALEIKPTASYGTDRTWDTGRRWKASEDGRTL